MSDRSSDKALFEFLSEAQEIVESLSRDLLQLDGQRAAGKYDPELVNGAFRSVHSLKGLAGLFGVTRMTTLAHTLESLLDSLRLGRVSLSPEILDLLFEAVELFGIFIADASANKETPVDLAGYFGRLENATRGGGSTAAAAAPAVAVASGGAAEYELDPAMLSVLTEYEEHRLRENLRAGRRLYRLHAAFDLLTIDKGLEELKACLKPVGEVLSYLPSAEAADENQIELDILVGSERTPDEIASAVAHHHASLRIFEVPRRQAPPAAGAAAQKEAQGRARGGEGVAAASVPPPTTSASASAPSALPGPSTTPTPVRSPGPGPSTSTGRSAPGAPASGEEDEERSSLKSVSQTVRVDIRKLDHLMNVVGELALAKAGIAAILEELQKERGLAELARRLHRECRSLERQLNELQSGILEVRMVPLGQMFDKLSRVVRKISRDAGKDIRLQISGADTELDKLIVEELSDPLMHILRNSIDHGIEPVDVRRRAGKPDAGWIAISAEQKGNHVVIEVADDGAGFDEERILETALRKKLIDTATAADLSRRDLLNLVFLPGFSTKEEATELSGRGVGMDVVKTNIARLSGIIDLASTPGQGARISITLPITLAIIQALVIRVAGRTYAVPLSAVLESLTLTKDEIRTIEGKEVIGLRGMTLPLVRLDALFRLARAHEPPDKMYVVVVGLAQHRLGLVVDELTGQQDIVIKNLGKALSGLPGIAGATELGGQQTVLVLDVAALVEETLRVGLPEAA